MTEADGRSWRHEGETFELALDAELTRYFGRWLLEARLGATGVANGTQAMQ